MNLTDINTISKYNNFLAHLDSFGIFQKKLTLIAICFWLFAGTLRTIMDKEIFFNRYQELPFMTLSIILGLLLASVLSYYYNRRNIIIILSGIFIGGAVILLSCPHDTAIKIAIYLISFAHYSSCCITSCVVFEYVDIKLIPALTWSFVFSYHLTKFVSLFIFSQINTNDHKQIIIGSTLLVFGLLQLIGSFFFKQSLRFLIDNDIQQAQQLALKISEQNKCTDERILNIIEGSFIWNKVNIKKYGLNCFSKYKSLARETYYLGLSFFCLGIFEKFALVIFQVNQRKKSAEFQHEVQLLWINTFQLIGFIPGIVMEKTLQRRKIQMASSVLGLIFSMILVILIRFIMIPHSLVAVFSLLGLNSFLGSVLFFFMFLQCVQFYPHTIRTLGLSICLSGYYLGQLVFNLHFYYVDDDSSSVQLVFCCSLIMIFHLYNTTQTLGKGIKYEIKQIQEREYNED